MTASYTLVELFSGIFRLKMGVHAAHGCVQYMGKNGKFIDIDLRKQVLRFF